MKGVTDRRLALEWEPCPFTALVSVHDLRRDVGKEPEHSKHRARQLVALQVGLIRRLQALRPLVQLHMCCRRNGPPTAVSSHAVGAADEDVLARRDLEHQVLVHVAGVLDRIDELGAGRGRRREQCQVLGLVADLRCEQVVEVLHPAEPVAGLYAEVTASGGLGVVRGDVLLDVLHDLA